MTEKESAMDHDAERGDGISIQRDVSPTFSSSTEDIRDKEVHVGASRTPSSTHSLEAAHADDQRDITSSSAPIAASIANSIRPAPIKVPRSNRRGLFGRFSILAEVEEPKDYPNKTKWFLTFVIAIAAAAAPMGSAIFFPSLLEVSEDLHTTPTITNLSVALYMLSMSIFPLWWSSFSETMGRRTIYLTSFSLFLLWNILSALSNSIAMLIVMRILGGGAAASVQVVGAGTIADIWAVKERGQAMGIFYLGPLMGPLFAPIIGGALAEKWGWRSTQWFLVIYGGVILVFLFFALPETLKVKEVGIPAAGNDLSGTPNQRPGLSRAGSTRSVHWKTKKWVKAAKRAFLDPLKIILNLRYPAVLLTVWLASITFGCLYALNISLESTFSKPPYNFSTVIVGLTYIPNSIGYILASLLGGRWTDKIMAREARKAGRYDEKGKLVYRPEDRMRENAWIAIFLYPGALIWYGWTAEKKVFWIIPLLANFFFGIGSMLIFSASTTMLTEFMPKRASAGVATNNFVRNIFSCVGGIVAQPLLDSIGNGWLFTGLGVIAAGSSVAIWAMRRFGPQWRLKMEAQLNS